eukprot:5270046-Prymnesium_polylepis.1
MIMCPEPEADTACSIGSAVQRPQRKARQKRKGCQLRRLSYCDAHQAAPKLGKCPTSVRRGISYSIDSAFRRPMYSTSPKKEPASVS